MAACVGMGIFNNVFERGGRHFTPRDLPPGYKTLMLLSLMDLDYAIYNIAGLEKSGTALEQAKRELFAFAEEFALGAERPLAFEDFMRLVIQYGRADDFEMRLRLARIFLSSFADPSEKPAGLNLKALLKDYGSWRNCLKATAIGLFSATAFKPDLPVHASFFLKNLRKAEENIDGPLFSLLSLRRTLYFYHYSHYVKGSLFNDKTDPNKCVSLCQYIFALYSTMHNNMTAALAAMRLFLIFSQKDRVLNDKNIAEIRKKAIFDRIRKAFSVDDSRQPIFVTPTADEARVIF